MNNIFDIITPYSKSLAHFAKTPEAAYPMRFKGKTIMIALPYYDIPKISTGGFASGAANYGRRAGYYGSGFRSMNGSTDCTLVFITDITPAGGMIWVINLRLSSSEIIDKIWYDFKAPIASWDKSLSQTEWLQSGRVSWDVIAKAMGYLTRTMFKGTRVFTIDDPSMLTPTKNSLKELFEDFYDVIDAYKETYMSTLNQMWDIFDTCNELDWDKYKYKSTWASKPLVLLAKNVCRSNSHHAYDGSTIQIFLDRNHRIVVESSAWFGMPTLRYYGPITECTENQDNNDAGYKVYYCPSNTIKSGNVRMLPLCKTKVAKLMKIFQEGQVDQTFKAVKKEVAELVNKFFQLM